MKKFLSYFFPVTKKISTEYNGTVELTYYNGKKMLNSAHANYSYDSLQRILKFGLTKVDLTNVDSVLLLGLGGGSVIKTLREDFNFSGKVTAVELDKKIIDIAETEFQVLPDTNLEIIYGDAFEFVKNTKSVFNLIIIDLFIDNRVPAVFYSPGFWEKISELVSTSGYFIFNAAVLPEDLQRSGQMIEITENTFTVHKYEAVEGTNVLLTGFKR